MQGAGMQGARCKVQGAKVQGASNRQHATCNMNKQATRNQQPATYNTRRYLNFNINVIKR